MSGASTIAMITAYNQQAAAEPPMHFSGTFQTPVNNFYSSEEVEIDILRGGEDVAIVVQDLSTGYRMNSDDLYTNKRFKAPVYKEAIPVNSYDLIKRMAGNDPYQNPDFRASLIMRIMNGMLKSQGKIRRAIELQASQLYTTGKLSLTNESGVALYELDYKPKATHFPTANVAWNLAGATMLADLQALAEIIRADGLGDPDEIHMGEGSFMAFIGNAAVKTAFDIRNITMGTIAPMKSNGKGGSYRGRVEIGNYFFDVYTYNGHYKHPQTGVSTKYLPDDKVVMRCSTGRMDATFGAVPNIAKLLGIQTGSQVLQEMPGRFSNSAGNMDLFVNAWLSQDGEQLFAGIAARPLLIPTAIDTYGCLDTGI